MGVTTSISAQPKSHRRAAVRFLALAGSVSPRGDTTYEGARCIVGPYLSVLGAGGSMVARDRRGAAFGLFHCSFGVAWFAGSIILGATCDHSVTAVAIRSFALQLFALPLLRIVQREAAPRDKGQTRSQGL